MSNLQHIQAKLGDMSLDIDASVLLIFVLPGPKTIEQTGLHVKLPWLNYLQQKRHQRVI